MLLFACLIVGALALLVRYPIPTLLASTGLVVIWLKLRGQRRLRRRVQAKTLGELLALTPAQFEAAVADLLPRLGYRRVELVGRSGDLGVDIRCQDASGRSVIVQCKRHAPGIAVGSGDMQSFIGMLVVHHRADRGLFVTTSGFTGPARDLAARHGIELFDGERLSGLLSNATHMHSISTPVIGGSW